MENTEPVRQDPSAEDRKIMGTREDAKAALILKAQEWRELRQPIMATGKELRARDQRERQVRFELANAALHWLWHQEHAA